MKNEKNIYYIAGASKDQSEIKISFPVSGENQKLTRELEDENFTFKIDSQEGVVLGNFKGTFEEITRLIGILKVKGFKT